MLQRKVIIPSLILVLGLGFFVAPDVFAATYDYLVRENVDHYGLKVLFDGPDKVYFGGTKFHILENNNFSTVDLSLVIGDKWIHPRNPYLKPDIGSMILGPDGAKLYMSGRFNEILGEERNGLAAIDTRTMELISWKPDFIESGCNDLVMSPDGQIIYAVGAPRGCAYAPGVPGAYDEKIIKIDAQTGTILDFDYVIPSDIKLTGDVIMSNDGNKLFVGSYNPYYISNDYSRYLILEFNARSGHVVIHELDLHSTTSKLYATPDGSKIYKNGYVETSPDTFVEIMAILDVSSGEVSYRTMPEIGMGGRVVFTNDGSRLFTITNKSDYTGCQSAVVMYDSQFTKYQIFSTAGLDNIDSLDISPDDQKIFLSGTYNESSEFVTIVEITVPQDFSIQAEPLVPGNFLIDILTPSASEWDFLFNKASRISPPDFSREWLAKEIGKPTVYYISNHVKWPILNAQVFEAWGFEWENIVEYGTLENYSLPGDKVYLDFPWQAGWQIPNGTLVQGSAKSVYVVIDGELRGIRNGTIFNQLGFQWNKIKYFPDLTIAAMPHGDDIYHVVHPDGTIIKYVNDPTVYIVGHGIKRAFVNEQVFLDYGYVWGQILEVPSDITYRTGVPIED
ncbi:hypothetical protein KJ969_01335 [Patescibacteria group bacterium]|nr:hypothetical protein [Patescibacteria group bacterium]MBU1922329.1 hypothetical protein [Patescibacteria group bacterium]